MLHVFEPNIGPMEAEAVWRQVMSGRVSPGERVAEFEAMLCAETGAKHAICCNSGTTALMLAMLSSESRTVAVPSYTFPAAANVAKAIGRTVEAWGIERSLTMLYRPNMQPRTVVFVSHNGDTRCADKFACLAGIERHDAIHDAAQSLGILRMDAPLALPQPTTTTLSFSGPKLVTTGQGGAVLTNYSHVADKIRALCDHGGGDWRKTRIHEAIGGNFRMSDLNAAIGVAQMKRLPELLGIRRERFTWYREHFPETRQDGWCMLVRTTKAKECIATLAERGYEALQPYRPLQESIPYRDNPVDLEAVRAANELLYLPVHHHVLKSDVDAICQTIKGIDPCSCSN